MSFLTPFSRSVASDDDRARYVRVAKGLFFAGVFAGVCIVFGWAAAPEDELKNIGPNLSRHKVLVFCEGLLWLGACFLPVYFRRQCRYIEGTVASILAFGVISHFAYLLVCWTGGLNNSVFAATFLSLLGVSLLLPEELAIRLALVLILLIESLLLVFQDPKYVSHNATILTLSGAAYFFAAVIRWFLDRDGK